MGFLLQIKDYWEEITSTYPSQGKSISPNRMSNLERRDMN